jgi:hypothetical protein
LDFHNLLEPITGAFQHSVFFKNARHHCGIKACGDFCLPYLRWYQPFATPAFAPTPTSATQNGTGYLAERFKAGITMLFYEQADLRNSGMDFTCFRATSAIEPSYEALTCGSDRLTLVPWNDTESSRQFARRRNQSEPITNPQNLPVRHLRHILRPKGPNHLRNCRRVDVVG